MTETPPPVYREVAISRDARGHYHASFVYEQAEEQSAKAGTVAFDLGLKTLATGVHEQGRVYSIGGFKGYRWYNVRMFSPQRTHLSMFKKAGDHFMQLYKAAYIYPVSSPPITDGIIAIDGKHIAAVGTAAEVMQRYPGAQVTDLGEVLLLPQAVNAHTHLELTALAELGKEYVPDRSFVGWILELLRRWRATPMDVLTHGAQEGCRMLVESGTAVVGDISNTHVSLEPLLESGLYGVIYHEIYSPDPANAAPLLQRAQENVRRWRSEYGEERIRFGVTLHTPFTVSPELFRLTVPWVIEENVPFCIHVAESPAETEYFLYGTGEIAQVLDPSIIRADWIPVPGVSPVQYLDQLGVLATHPLLAHGVQVNQDDLRLLKEHRASVAHCPRSNFLLNCGRMPIEAYQEIGALLAMGTDSLSSSPSLSIWEEGVSAMRMHRAAGVNLDPHDLLRICTLDGARALGFDDRLGSLEPGKLARLAVGKFRDEDEPGKPRTADEILQRSAQKAPLF